MNLTSEFLICEITLSETKDVSAPDKQQVSTAKSNILEIYTREHLSLLVLQSVVKPLYHANIDSPPETSQMQVSFGESL